MGMEIVQDYGITTYKGKHFLGKQAEEAKSEGHSVFKDFKKIDSDNDNIISFDEITEQRDKTSRKKRIWGNIFMGIGAYYCINGIKLQKYSSEVLEMATEAVSDVLDKKLTPSMVKRDNLINALLFAAIGIIKVVRANKIDKDTQEQANKYYKKIAS